MELPPNAEVSDEIPDVLYWLYLVEKWGPMQSGGHLEQPWFFMQDLEAAGVGRVRVEEVRAANIALNESYTLRHR